MPSFINPFRDEDEEEKARTWRGKENAPGRQGPAQVSGGIGGMLGQGILEKTLGSALAGKAPAAAAGSAAGHHPIRAIARGPAADRGGRGTA